MAPRPTLQLQAVAHEQRAAQSTGDARTQALVAAARTRLQSGHIKRAITLLEAAQSSPEQAPHVAALIQAAQGRLHGLQARPIVAIEALTAAIEALDDVDALCTAHIDLAEAYAAAERPEDAASAVAAAEALPHNDATKHRIAIVQAASMSDADAFPKLQRVVREAQQQGDLLAHGQALTALGCRYVNQRDYVRGRAAHEAALQLHVQTGHRAGAAASLGGLGLIRLGSDAPADAVTYLNKAVKRCAEIGDLAAEAAWRTYLDDALVRLDRAELRARELERFVDVTRRLGDDAWTASLCSALGTTWLEVRNPAAALIWHQRALAISERRDDPLAQAVDHANLGLAHVALASRKQADASLERARALHADHPAVHTLDAAIAKAF